MKLCVGACHQQIDWQESGQLIRWHTVQQHTHTHQLRTLESHECECAWVMKLQCWPPLTLSACVKEWKTSEMVSSDCGDKQKSWHATSSSNSSGHRELARIKRGRPEWRWQERWCAVAKKKETKSMQRLCVTNLKSKPKWCRSEAWEIDRAGDREDFIERAREVRWEMLLDSGHCRTHIIDNTDRLTVTSTKLLWTVDGGHSEKELPAKKNKAVTCSLPE